jgi:pilus assembly protein FimV
VTSPNAVKEPFLDFLLSVNWSSGKMMREYTLLLDPPVFEKEEKAGRVSAAVTQPAKVVRGETPVAQARPRMAPAGSYGPTTRTDTLWGIALEMRPDESVSVQQMMLALLKKNPAAFGSNNINNLKAGYILRSPDMDVITQLSRSEAAKRSDRQYQEWLAAKGKAPAVSGRQQRVAAAPGATAKGAGQAVPAPSTAGAAKSEARLQLLSPDEEALIRSGAGTGAGSTSGEETASLRKELAIAMESAEATRQENSDLRSRLDELEKQLQSVQKLLTLKGDTLGALQAGAQAKQEEAPAPAKPAEAAPAATAESKPAPAAEAPKQAEKPKKPKKPKKAAAPPPAETSLIDQLLANPLYLGAAGGAVVVLLVVVALIRRRRAAAEEGDFVTVKSVAEAIEAKGDKGAKSEEEGASTEDTETKAESSEEVSMGDFGGGGMGAIHAEEADIDPIAEADVYMAYRRYEQAEALLKEAVVADPDRHELKLKLLEIYYATKDTDSFEAQAESLYAALAGGGDETLWNKAIEMGHDLLPDHPLFAEGGSAAAGAGESEEEGDEADLGIAELGEDAEEDIVTDPLADLGDLDFDMGELAEGGVSEETEGAGAGEDLSEGLADLDLDMGELAEGGVSEETEGAGEDLSEGLADLDLDMGELAADEATEETEGVGEDLSEGLADLDLGGLGESDDAGEAASTEELTDLSSEDELDLGSLDLEDQAAEGEGAPDEAAESELSLNESDSWTVDAAQSEFTSRDVEGETDGLLDTARKAQDESAALAESLDMDSGTEETAAAAEAEEAAVSAEGEESIDPLAELGDLGEMDLSDVSDEEGGQNDDIFEGGDDMVGTKLDLARAYIDMGDQDGARTILGEVVEEGDDEQRQEAEELIRQIS